jgi:tetratricopeptide (TPR) repeat protein
MLQQYLTWADRESPEVNEILGAPLTATGTERTDILESSGDSERFISNFTDALLRRSLEFDPTNPQAKYLIAHRLQRTGNERRARQLLRSIAPEDGSGFAPAHAWIAEEMVRQARQGKELNRDVLAHHLTEAIRWPLVSPSALLLHAGFLEAKGLVDEAIQVAKLAAQRQPSYLLALAEIARKNQREGIRTVALTNAEAHFRERIQSSEGTEQDIILLAQVLVQQNQLRPALEVLAQGLKKDQVPTAERRRAISEVYRLLFLRSVVTNTNGTSVQLELLEQALHADPTNPLIAEEVAKLNALGIQAGEALITSLQQRLAEGKATAVTHLLIANHHLKLKEYEKAITHLEIAHRHNPDAVVVLNNLALALMLKDKSQLERGLALINRALSLTGPHPEFLDSRGQIYRMVDQYLDAASSYEQAIRGDPTRRGTREALIGVYEAAGLPEMAAAHREVLERLTAKEAK